VRWHDFSRRRCWRPQAARQERAQQVAAEALAIEAGTILVEVDDIEEVFLGHPKAGVKERHLVLRG
jgi:hypothetical protein